MTFAATLADDRATIEMRHGDWQHSIPVGDLQRWLRLYRGLRDRKGQVGHAGPYAAHFLPGIAALERVAAQLREVRE